AQTTDGDSAKQNAESGIVHGITNGVSILLPTAWQEFDPGGVGPPDALAPYAPPFHLGGVLALENRQLPGILQFTTSTNPLAGHDPNWLDTQMHMPAGSGMSVLDLLFYLFFPPDGACINQVLGTNGGATFAPAPGSTSSSAPPELQVSYHCRHEATLQGFFSAQVSSGITFVQTNDGPRVYGMLSQFYLAPMERATSPGMTWYVFEALRTSPVSQGAATHFNLPANLQGEEADFFWAIGAAGSFPWVNDGAHANQPLIHVAFATIGTGGSKRAEFLALLQKVEAHGDNAAPAK
ncbi:MAG: hypothetical protein WBY66_14800, partial [Candidatus Acidiferrales bacterium]